MRACWPVSRVPACAARQASAHRKRKPCTLVHRESVPNLDPARVAPLGHEIEVELVVLLAQERRQATVPPLGHVVRDAGNDNSCESGHAEMLTHMRGGVRPLNAYDDTMKQALKSDMLWL